MDGQICDHEQCTCPVSLGEEFCGEPCRREAAKAEDIDPHGRCGCKHTTCMSGA